MFVDNILYQNYCCLVSVLVCVLHMLIDGVEICVRDRTWIQRFLFAHIDTMSRFMRSWANNTLNYKTYVVLCNI